MLIELAYLPNGTIKDNYCHAKLTLDSILNSLSPPVGGADFVVEDGPKFFSH
jgi:hypothetical protein